MDTRYKIVYRKKYFTGTATDETLVCKELQLISLLATLIDNDYQIRSVKLMEDEKR